VDETAAEAAVREVGEETGLAVRLLAGPMLPAPAGFPHSSVRAPWWMVEMAAGSDGHTAGPHVHVDHVFVALANDMASAGGSEHEVRWFTEVEIASVDGIGEDSRLQAKELFARIDAMSRTGIVR
jgi:8-oxo-dGTP pyrophosphatase MutT (NUDIX family)